MNRFIDSLTEYLALTARGGGLTEHREIKLYSNGAGVQFLRDDRGIPCDHPIPGALTPGVAFMLLDCYYESRDPGLEGKTVRERYLALPRGTRAEKLAAQVYRVLKLYHMALIHPAGVIEDSRGVIRAGCTERGTAFCLIVTKSGLALLEAFVTSFLNSFRRPHGEAYVEALLSQYYADITNEIKKFHDEDADVLRFRKKYEFNRYFRLDCGNPKYVIKDGQIVFEIADPFYNPQSYPIDFFVMVNEELHVIPVEALTDKKLSLSELPDWKARVIDGKSASSQLHLEFGYETVSNGGPMS